MTFIIDQDELSLMGAVCRDDVAASGVDERDELVERMADLLKSTMLCFSFD